MFRWKKWGLHKRFADICEKAGVTAMMWGIFQLCYFEQASSVVSVIATLSGLFCAIMSICLDIKAGRS